MVALTFDAGANADAVAPVLATLDRKGIEGTFFLTGDFVADFPDAVRRIATRGHRLGNHSATHPQFTELSKVGIKAEVLGAERSIRAVARESPRPLFRFPFGDRTSRTIHEVNNLGYVAVRWTVDTLGWQGTSKGKSVASVTSRVLSELQPGEIVLMHLGSHPTDGSTLDADALGGIIDAIRARGYEFVTLDSLLALNAARGGAMRSDLD